MRPQELRSAREISMMRKAGLLVWEAHQLAASMIAPGITTGEIDAAVEAFFHDHRAEPLFKNYPNSEPDAPPFPAVTCISINEEVVHGIPGSRKLLEGDVVSIDMGCKWKGWCGDAAMSHPVGQVSPSVQELLDVTRGVLDLAIQRIAELVQNHQSRRNRWPRWKEVATVMEKYVKQNGFSVVEQFVGHGIGKKMHELPQVPNFVDRRFSGYQNFKLCPGLVIAIEPMVNMGTKEVHMLADHWTQVTADGQPSAHFEHTVAVTETGCCVLTAAPEVDQQVG